MTMLPKDGAAAPAVGLARPQAMATATR